MTTVLKLAPAPVARLKLTGPNTSRIVERADPPAAIVGVIGPPGPPGDARTVTAAEALGGHRAITVDGRHATTVTLDRLAGISTAAGAVGTLVPYVAAGPLSEPSWAWTPGLPLFVTGAGVLTQTAPSSGVARRVAWAVSATLINIDPFPTIQLA